ncbi:hypothetical protein N7510_011589 [Penicillium lagena]|uniref:uncharacterized protein n=1 Tax=Penicillium lagena TaxID=94218 RepID=UPI0025403C91|nr:uncharacterized protein N7510_011589 [Penicillium lagena]KAJ5602055.1 hypothetical protein N7510_011589 [Penicillium lagena]
MSDNPGPGVRNLLARFENSSPNPVTSPPSRGRSPIGSDTSGSTRPLSRVRASFVNVDGALQSNQASPLRKASGRGEGVADLFGPKIGSGDSVVSGRDSVASPTPSGGQDSIQKLSPELPTKQTPGNTAQNGTGKAELPVPAAEALSKPKELPIRQKDSTTTSAPSTENLSAPSQTVKKRPSTIGSTKTSIATKQTTPAATSTTAKAASASKPPYLGKLLRNGPPVPFESLAVLRSIQRQSRLRGQLEAENAKPTAISSPPFVKPRPKSPTKPVRLPASMTASTQASAARLGNSPPSNSTTTTTLARKPSTLKTAPGPPRAKTPTASSVRRQSSRPSLAAQPAAERPSSRVSANSRGSDIGTTKPVNDGFLARMMRPTASSASKTLDKPDAKVPARAPSTVKPPRPSMGRVPERSASQLKPKRSTAPLHPQSEKSQPVKKDVPIPKQEPKPAQPAPESEKENVVEPPAAIPEEPTPVAAESAAQEKPAAPLEKETAAALAEPPIPEIAVERATEAVAEPSEPVSEPVAEPLVETASEKPVETTVADTPVAAPAEPRVETTAEPIPKSSAESPTETPVEPSADELEEQATEPTTATEAVEENSSPAHVEESGTEPVQESTPVLESTGDAVTTTIEERETPKPELDASESQERQSGATVSDSATEATIPELITEPAETKSIDDLVPAAQPETESKEHDAELDVTELTSN